MQRFINLNGTCWKRVRRVVCAVILSGVFFAPCRSQQIQIDEAQLPAGALAMLDSGHAIDVVNAPLRDVLRAIGMQFGLNLSIDETIDRNITLRLNDIPVIDALLFICREYGLRIEQTGHIFRIEPYEEEELPPAPLDVTLDGGILSANLTQAPLGQFLRELTSTGAINIVPAFGVSGALTGFINGVPFLRGLEALLESNGYDMRSQNGIWYVDYGRRSPSEEVTNSRLRVLVQDSLIVIRAENTSLTDVLMELRRRLPQTAMVLHPMESTPLLTIQMEAESLEECLELLFQGTALTFRRIGETYIIAEKTTEGMLGTRLIRLRHAKSESLLELLPEHLKLQGKIQVVKEQNGLLVTGSEGLISEVQSFISELDFPTPQILIEALVVDFTIDRMSELGITFGAGGSADSAGIGSNRQFSFGLPGEDGAGGLEVQGGQTEMRRFGGFWGDILGISARGASGPLGSVLRFVGRLPDDFYFKINALSEHGVANVRSRPQVSTLNGHTAKLTFGTTQYFLLNSSNFFPYGYAGTTGDNTNNPYGSAITQKFETIEANVTFEITPWVGTSGEITAEIKPDFQTPEGGFVDGVPPTISSRALESTVRLQDGETIVLGGLIQESEQVVQQKIPFLGNIPLIGRLFRNKKKSYSKQELIIFVTPHVFFGDERDEHRWNEINETFSSRDAVLGNPRETIPAKREENR